MSSRQACRAFDASLDSSKVIHKHDQKGKDHRGEGDKAITDIALHIQQHSVVFTRLSSYKYFANVCIEYCALFVRPSATRCEPDWWSARNGGPGPAWGPPRLVGRRHGWILDRCRAVRAGPTRVTRRCWAS
jgi:hypothetical protein